jgi:hypothetical protein
MFIRTPEEFATWLNGQISDAYRRITADDVRLVIICKLIGRYRFFGSQDLEAVRRILR